jgi:hypothetical protein
VVSGPKTCIPNRTLGAVHAGALRLAGWLGVLLAAKTLVACEDGPLPLQDDPRVRFRAAIAGAPGGAFLSVWGDPRGRRAYVVGGYVGLDPAQAPRGAVGRLVEYRSPGLFVTRCTVDSALWWVSGVENAGVLELWAVGDRGRIVRMRADRCETLTTGLSFPGGDPTFWGVLARAPNDVWIVGGSPRPDGPRGVLLHGDGTAWRQERLPAGATEENLYKIAADGDALYVVGSGGLILRRDARDGEWTRVGAPVRSNDHRLFTVSCASGACFAVGGGASGLLLSGEGANWREVRSAEDAAVDDLPGLNGVWARAADDVFAVGVDGFLLHVGGGLHRPRRPLTTAALHGVGGFGSVVLAVGGELSNPSPTQRGVILVQDDAARTFTLDGRLYASGSLMGSAGGAGQ